MWEPMQNVQDYTGSGKHQKVYISREHCSSKLRAWCDTKAGHRILAAVSNRIAAIMLVNWAAYVLSPIKRRLNCKCVSGNTASTPWTWVTLAFVADMFVFLNAFDSTWCNLSSRCSDLDIVILVPGMVVNIIMSSASLRTGESWTPVCLSQYNDKAQIGTEHSDSHTMGTKQLWSGNLFRIFAVQHHYSMQGFAYAYISCIEGTDFGTAEAFEHSVREAVGTICHKICHTICHSYRF